MARLRGFNARASAVLDQSYQSALAEFQKAKSSWEDFFPEIGPPDLRFLADTEGMRERAGRAYKAQQHGSAIASLSQAASIYRTWASDLEALHRRVDPVWNALPRRKIQNKIGMRFVRTSAGKYLSIWETRVMDFARFVQEEEARGRRTYLEAGEFWKNPGYPQSPVHPVVGIDRRTAHEFSAWVNAKAQHLGQVTTELVWMDEWKTMAEQGGAIPPVPIGIFPKPEEWSSDHYRTKYREERFDARRFINPVGLGKPNSLGVYDMDGNVWEWAMDIYEHPNSPSSAKSAWVLLGGGRFGEISYHAFEPPEANWRYIGHKEAIGFRVMIVVQNE